jgi:hypothetical protein
MYKTTVPGAMQSSISFPESGGAAINIPLDVAPGRGAPSLALSHDSANIDESVAGGFSLTGVEAVTRCNKTLALDGENRTVQYDKHDALCAFGKRLIVVSDLGDTIHYTTWPDMQIKVVQQFSTKNESSFEASLPSG